MTNEDKIEHEKITYGPFNFERVGRIINTTTNWKPGEYENFIEFAISQKDDIEKQLNGFIGEVKELLKKYNPLRFIEHLAINNVFTNAEEYSELTNDSKEHYLEYVQCLMLAENYVDDLPDPTIEILKGFDELLEKIFIYIVEYYSIETMEQSENKIEVDLRFKSLIRYLLHKGDSYPRHHLDLIEDMFKNHSGFLKENIGFDHNDLITCLHEVERQITYNYKDQAELLLLIKESHQLFRDFADKIDINKYSSIEEVMKEFDRLPNQKAIKAKIEKSEYDLKESIFKIKAGDKSPTKLLDILSMEFGDNVEFLKFDAWPTNSKKIYYKPIIKIDGEYYCFSYQTFFRHVYDILEEWIQGSSHDYYKNKFQKQRATVLENKSIEYFKEIFPDAKVYQSLFYNYIENGQNKRAETDGIMLFDNNLFIIEAKAGNLPESAQRGSIKSLKQYLKKLIEDAYEQGIRTKNYIASETVPIFEYENGSIALELPNKEKIENVYIINTLLQNIAQTTQLSSLKHFNFIKGKEWPWSVYINDLRIISEINEFPTEFLLYLERRLNVNENQKFFTMDELDFYTFYLHDGLYLEEEEIQELDLITPIGFTEDLDRYYNYLEGNVSSGEKPKLNISEKYKKLINKIEETQNLRFTTVAKMLLSFNSDTRKDVLDQLGTAFQRLEQDGRYHSFTLLFDKEKFGVTLCVYDSMKPRYWEEWGDYSEIKLYQNKYDKWIFISVKGKEFEHVEFKVIEKKWVEDEEMEKRLKEYCEIQVSKFKKRFGKIGRNDQCPCGSRRKYKNCCSSQKTD